MSNMTDLSDDNSIESGSISIHSALSDSMSSIELIDSYPELDNEPALLVLEEDSSSMPINLEDQLAEAMQEEKEGEKEIKKTVTKTAEVENNDDYQLCMDPILNEVRRHGDPGKTTPLNIPSDNHTTDLVLEKPDVEKEDQLAIPLVNLHEFEQFFKNFDVRPPTNVLDTSQNHTIDDTLNANENKDLEQAIFVDQGVSPAVQQKPKKKARKHKKRKSKKANLSVASSSFNNIHSPSKELSDQEVYEMFKRFELASHNLYHYIETMQNQPGKLSQFSNELKSAKVGSAFHEIKQQEMTKVEEESSNEELKSDNLTSCYDLSDDLDRKLIDLENELKTFAETPSTSELVDLLPKSDFDIELNQLVNDIISIIKMPSAMPSSSLPESTNKLSFDESYESQVESEDDQFFDAREP